VKEVADAVGLEAFPKTSGSSGIHIYIPLKPTNEYDKVAEFARLFASEVARRAPRIATIERTIAKRKSTQVYVDWMQNARGKSLAAPFTARAKPGATVSMPLEWKQISKGVEIKDFTITNVPDLLKKKGDAWKNFFASRQSLRF
jgi:bifunctional non-homologous end joining protein LigD